MEVVMLLVTYLQKYVFPIKQNTLNVKVPNMIARTNEEKTLVKDISYDYKCKFNSAASNSNQK